MPDAQSPTTLQIILDLSKKMVLDDARMRWRMVLGICLELAGVTLGILGPFFLKSLVDAFAAKTTIGSILTLVGLFVVSWSGASILSTIRSVFSTRVIDQITQDMATSAFRSYLPESASSRASDSGATLGLLERLPYSLSIVIDGLIWRTLPIVLQLTGSLWLVCVIIPLQYAAILAVVMAGYVLTTWLTAKRHKQLSADANFATGTVSREAGDILRNARRVVFNGALELEIDHLQRQFSNKATANNRMMWSLVWMVAWQYGVVGAGLIALLSLGTVDVIYDRMTIGDFVLLQAYALRLAAPLSGIGFVLSQSAIAIVNVRDVIAMSSSVGTFGHRGGASNGAARILLQGVSFSYSPEHQTLNCVSVDLPAGSFTVVVGPNGAGKSTLAQIMAGVLDPDAGQVLIDGQDLAHVPANDRHRYVLYVPQMISLFNRTLAANGLYPPSTSSEAELATLLTQWRFHEGDQPLDLKTIVGEQGERLSGGQIQKLELARVAGIRVPVAVFDESTSALTSASETKTVVYLRKRLRGTTLVMISHRVEMARMADTVLFVTEGKIAGQGCHHDLLVASPEYRDLWLISDTVL